MSKHDVVVALFTIVYGLMITELYLSVHRLIRGRRYIRWDWLPLLAAWYLFLTILKNWWDLALIPYSGDWMNLFFFLAYGHLLALVYLAANAVLPDEQPTTPLDLKAFYLSIHRYFWWLMTAVIVFSLGIALAKGRLQGREVPVESLIGNGVLVLVTLGLGLTRRLRWHRGLLILITLMVVLEIVGKGLAS